MEKIFTLSYWKSPEFFYSLETTQQHSGMEKEIKYSFERLQENQKGFRQGVNILELDGLFVDVIKA